MLTTAATQPASPGALCHKYVYIIIIMRGNMLSCAVYGIHLLYTLSTAVRLLFAVLPGELSRWEGCDERGLHRHLHRGRGSVPLEWVSGHPAKIPS